MKAEGEPRSPFLQFFVNHPAVGMVGFIAAVITIASFAYFLLVGKEKRELTYLCNPVKTSIVQAGEFKALEVYVREKRIETDVTAIQVAVWNRGKLPIRPSDVLEDFVLVLSPSAKILDAAITKQSRNVVNLTLLKDFFDQGRIPFAWKILEHNDGGVIQLIFAGSTSSDVELHGSIIGQASPRRATSPTESAKPSNSIKTLKRSLLFFSGMFIFFVVLSFVIDYFQRKAKRKKSGQAVKMAKREIRFEITYFVFALVSFALYLIIPEGGSPFGF